MKFCSVSAHCPGSPTTAMPAPGRTWVMPVHRCGSMVSPIAASSRTRRVGSDVAKSSFTKAFCPSPDRQPHAEADLLLAAVRGGHRLYLRHVGADSLVGIAPEQMHVGMLGRNL